jgi:PAS domain S-box-containing protein
MADEVSNTILVVDDNEPTRDTVTRQLLRAGFKVREAATGADGLRLAAEKPDLIILDVRLPDLGGHEVCRRIKTDPATSSIPIVHLSPSLVESADRSEGPECGADGYLTDPVEPRELLAIVLALLRVRRAERAAREQRELMHVTLGSISDGVIVTDADGCVTGLNPVAETLTGWTSREAFGRPLEEVFRILNEQTRQPVLNPVAKVLRDGEVVGLANHAVLLGKDGSLRPIDDRAATIRDADGKVIGVVLVFRDVTELRHSEEEIGRLLAGERRLAERLRQVAAVSLTINAALSLESVLHVITEEARTIIGAHQALTTLLVDDSWARARHTFSLSDKYAGYRTNPTWPDGRGLEGIVGRANRPLRLTQAELEAHPAWRGAGPEAGRRPPLRGWLAAPLVGRSGRHLGLIQLSDRYEGDFTAESESILVQLAQVASVAIENARLYEELREADRRKDEFLAMLAHELRNPMAPILNAVHVLRLRGADSPETRWATEVANRQVLQLGRLVDDLLDVSRISRGKITLQTELVELRAVAERALETSRPFIDSRRHTLDVALPSDPLLVEADPVRLAQILANLLNNAAKYTPEGGRVRLAVERDRGEAAIRVSDTGMGIAPEMLPRVFDLFSQAERTLDRAQGGLGIGLTLVRRLTELHGGKVAAFSEGPGRGSEFEVRLPLLAGKPGSSPSAPAPGQQDAAHGRRVLVVDDNKDSAESLTMLLRLGGCEVHMVHDGATALLAAEAYHPDLVLLDIGLPGMNGYEVARAIRARPVLQGAVLVALTGYGGEDDRRRSREAGFDHHLVKPVGLDALRGLLASVARASP